MNILLLVLAGVAELTGIVCGIMILIDAFQDEIWKGVVCLLCGFYFLYYALFEFDHENKWLLVIGALCGNGIALGIMSLRHQANGLHQVLRNNPG